MTSFTTASSARSSTEHDPTANLQGLQHLNMGLDIIQVYLFPPLLILVFLQLSLHMTSGMRLDTWQTAK